MSSHLPPNPYINPLFPFILISPFTLPFLKLPSPLKFALLQARQWRRLVGLIPTGRGYARAPPPLSRVLQLSPPPTQARLPLSPQLPPLPPLPQLLSRALPLLMLRAPPLWPLPRGDNIPGLAPLRLLHLILGQLEGPHNPRGPGPRAQGSHPLRDLGRHPHCLIRAFPEPQTYPMHLLSGGPSSLATPSQGMLTAAGEISTGRFTTISHHLPRTRSSETPCSSCRDTI